MAEELGFIMSVGFLVLLGFWFARGMHIAESAPDGFARYVAIGCLGWMGIQIIMNIGSILGLLPLTGVTLPFISYGGTSMTMTLFAVGVMVNISRS
jgi:cell division protein FtsW